MKRCSRCGETKPQAEFPRRLRTPTNRGHRDGFDYYCYVCRRLATAIAKRRRRIRNKQCVECRDGQHGDLCRGVPAGCGCGCRAMLGLEGPFEFGDPTAPSALDRGVA